ncbi:hypothetical protein CRV09_00260 [Candidatus Pantoea edessiphila]|uniref:Inner membrane protein YbhL n=1 Tax=Candidatus Pantoea edessiphila TaxID=2044610 RepID=A0A2P5T2C3_9GAMM|nr:Bax inhibitor-1/YccA family protein [Candidatus Pantoea edessiphila]PPI88739.1 hypothetical protein CRV09_00260 [Candidatus Pantoea edessiphila]
MNRYSKNGSISHQSVKELQTYMAHVYGWMTCGLILTSFVSWLVAHTPILINFVFNNKSVLFTLIFIQLTLTIIISSAMTNLSSSLITGMFMFYSMLTGLVTSHIFLLYHYSSISITFFISASMFGIMSIYGYTTKKDLSCFKNILLMGLIGLVVSSLINFVLKSSSLTWLITYIGILLFVVLTAYDTQKLKNLGNKIDISNSTNLRNKSIAGAFILYLDFINLFNLLLKICGDRNK